ncbi:MAG: TetR/AcrR family transcriptional regulator [Planctomycetaceae bacterium]
MNKPTRKEREWNEREARILEVSRRLLMEHGYLGLKMDRLRGRNGVFKGTIYQHFSSKEDVIMELAAQTFEKRVELLGRASRFNGGPENELRHWGWYRIVRQEFRRLLSGRADRACRFDSGKNSPERREKLTSCELRCMGIVTGIIRDAIEVGDLTRLNFYLPNNLHLECGLSRLEEQHHCDRATCRTGVENPFEAIINNIQMLLDGLNWKPLSHEIDYKETMERIAKEIFADLLVESQPA